MRVEKANPISCEITTNLDNDLASKYEKKTSELLKIIVNPIINEYS
tara:strand:- start:76 stop:213 length:138 start_codon:yes stop_codon:yes gene_type:complete